MKNLAQIGGVIREFMKENSPTILSVAAGVGTVVTAYLASQASFRAAKVIDEDKGLKENAKRVWRFYIPTGISTVSTIVCIAGANRMGVAKTLAAQAALSVSERAYSEYRDKVVEELGPGKDQAIRDKVAEDRVTNNPPSSNIVTGPGSVLCHEAYTGRYFTCDMETLRKAVNTLNERVLKHDYATMDDFYYILGLDQTSISGQMGWKSDRLLELMFSTVLSPDGRPCISFEYNYVKPL